MLVVFSTFPDEATARIICATLVAEGLVSCANILPQVTSIYRWQGFTSLWAGVAACSGTLENTHADGLEKMVNAIRETGWCVWPGFLQEGLAADLSRESLCSWEEGAFRRAGVGRGNTLAIRDDVRTDHVMWLRDGEATPCQRAYLESLDGIRVALNRSLFLGLVDFEGHFAVYPPGGFYKPHLDRHQETQDRIVSVILYLNPAWQSGDGGELRIWTTPGDKEGESITVEPRMGTMVCFLAGDFWHEVLPAKRTRASNTGWFRGRAV